MSKILLFIASLFTSGSTGANAAGNAVVNVATVAALSPAVIWIVANKDVTFLSFTISYGELALMSAGVAAMLKFAHIMRRGSIEDRAP
jgi:hypothetical protein